MRRSPKLASDWQKAAFRPAPPSSARTDSYSAADIIAVFSMTTPQPTAKLTPSVAQETAQLPRDDHGHDARPMLVLQWTHPPIWDPQGDRRRIGELRRRHRVASRARNRGRRS